MNKLIRSLFAPFIALSLLVSSVTNAHQPPSDIDVLFLGQSNAQRMDANDLSYFNSKYNEYSGFTSTANKSASGGSALLRANISDPTDLSDTNYWIEKTGTNSDGSGQFIKGPKLNDAIATGFDADFVIWIQGEQDGTKINNSAKKDDYKEGLSYLFDEIKSGLSLTNEARFGIFVTGRRLGASASVQNRIQYVRQAQHELSEIRDDVAVISDTYDISLEDSVHYSLAGKQKVMRRAAESAASYFGDGQPFLPIPKVTHVTLNSANNTELLVEIKGAESLVKGSNSDALFSARLGATKAYVLDSKKISDSLIHIILDRPITASYVLHIANGELVGVDVDGSKRIRNEHFLPISSGRYSINSVNWP